MQNKDTTAGARRESRISPQRRTERFDGRLDVDTKQLFQHAADISGCSLTTFVFTAAREKAAKMIERERLLRLDAEASVAFADALLADMEPNERLKKAAHRYRTVKG